MLGSCCATLGAKQTHESQGTVEEAAGVKTYKIGQGKPAIILFSDIFGYELPNTRKIADYFSEAIGATVYVPDCFQGDPIDVTIPNYRDLLPEWLKKHPVSDGCTLAEKFISTIKEQHESIQVMGFCYGAKLVVHLITRPEASLLVKSGIVAHPAFLEKEETEQVKRPVLFLCAEDDFTFSNEMKEHFEKELIAHGLGTFITYPGTVHGFVNRPDGSEASLKGSEKSLADAIVFLQKNI